MRLRDHSRLSKRTATYCGLAAPLVALSAIALATVLAAPETFTWYGRALSDMGRPGTRTFLLFNGGLIAGGLFGIPFAWRLWVTSSGRVERLGVVLLVTSVVGMISVGVFFLGHTEYYLERNLHFAAALTFFGVAPFAQWVYGTGQVLDGARGLGLLSIWFGIVHPVTWLVWLVSRAGATDSWAWFAVPEFVAALAFGGWILVLAGDLHLADTEGKESRD